MHENTVLIDNSIWMKYGFRITRWIDLHISEGCYRFRFTAAGDPVGIAFDDREQAIMFKLVMSCDVESLVGKLNNT